MEGGDSISEPQFPYPKWVLQDRYYAELCVDVYRADICLQYAYNVCSHVRGQELTKGIKE